MGYVRDKEKLQPEVCDVTGRLVPAEDGVIAEAEGLEGKFVGDTQPWLASVRDQLSFNQTRGLSPPPSEEPDLGPHGGRHWFDTWKPSDLGAALAGWWRNDYLMEIGEGYELEAWPDASGNDGPDFDATLPLPVEEDGRLHVRMFGSGSARREMSATFSPTLPQALTVCIVARLRNIDALAHYGIFGGAGTSNQTLVGAVQVGDIPVHEILQGGGVETGTTPRDGDWHAYLAQFGGDASPSLLRIDGDEEVSDQFADGPVYGAMTVGNFNGGAGPSNLDVREIFIVKRILTAAEIASAEEYMAGIVET